MSKKKKKPGPKRQRKAPPTDDFEDRWDAWARKRSAWVGYLYARQQERLEDEERSYRDGNQETRQRIEAERKKRASEPRSMYIG